MMNTSTKISAINDEMLRNITGGNHADCCREYQAGAPMYNVGDIVEVYTTIFHVTTNRAKIIGIEKKSNLAGKIVSYTGLDTPTYYFEYTVQYLDLGFWTVHSEIEKTTAEQIQRA